MSNYGPLGHLCSRLKVVLLTTVIVVFFPVIGAAFYIHAGFDWLLERVGFRHLRADGILFASAYAAIATLAACRLAQGHPLTRFNDIFLLGIVLTAYRFTWRSASYLFVIALSVLACLQPGAPAPADWYRLASFTVLSICSILVVARLKTSPAPARLRSGNQHSAVGGHPASVC